MERSDLFMAFACSLRNGQLHESKGASATTIEATLRECAGIMVAREFADPRRHHPAQPQLDTRFRQQFKQWKDEDPTPKPEHALPNSTVQLLARSYSASPHIKFRIIADLIIVAHFFLLRVCEYTNFAHHPNRPATTTRRPVVAKEASPKSHIATKRLATSGCGHDQLRKPEKRRQRCSSPSYFIRKTFL